MARDMLPIDARKEHHQYINRAFGELPDDTEPTQEQIQKIYADAESEFADRVIIDWDQLDEEQRQAVRDLAVFSMPSLKEAIQPLLDAHAAGDGRDARLANKTQIMFLASKEDVTDAELDTVETMLADYRSRFPLSREEDREGLYHVLSNLMFEFAKHDDFDRLRRAAEDEMDYLRKYPDIPHPSWQVVIDLSRHLTSAGFREEAIEMLDREIAYQRSHAEQTDNEDYATYFTNMAKGQEVCRTGLLMKDSQIKPIAFGHVVNADGPLDFDSLRRCGKFVLIDVFTVWCGPCIGSFPELKTLQERYGDRVTLIGMTPYQEMMVNHGAEVEENLSPDREAELMDTFIQHHELTWPVVFVDPEGIVRFYDHPLYLSHVLDDLLNAESD